MTFRTFSFVIGVTSYQDIGDCLKLVIEALRYGDIKPWVWRGVLTLGYHRDLDTFVESDNFILFCVTSPRFTETAAAPSASSSWSLTTSRSMPCLSQVSPLSTCCLRWVWTRWGRITLTTSLVTSSVSLCITLCSFNNFLTLIFHRRVHEAHFPWY